MAPVAAVEVVAVDSARRGVGEVHRPVVGTPADAVRDREAAVHRRHAEVRLDAIELSDRRAELAVERARPETARAIDLTVVEAFVAERQAGRLEPVRARRPAHRASRSRCGTRTGIHRSCAAQKIPGGFGSGQWSTRSARGSKRQSDGLEMSIHQSRRSCGHHTAPSPSTFLQSTAQVAWTEPIGIPSRFALGMRPWGGPAGACLLRSAPPVRCRAARCCWARRYLVGYDASALSTGRQSNHQRDERATESHRASHDGALDRALDPGRRRGGLRRRASRQGKAVPARHDRRRRSGEAICRGAGRRPVRRGDGQRPRDADRRRGARERRGSRIRERDDGARARAGGHAHCRACRTSASSSGRRCSRSRKASAQPGARSSPPASSATRSWAGSGRR